TDPTADDCSACVRRGARPEDLEQCALARAVAADEPDDVPMLDLEIDVAQRPDRIGARAGPTLGFPALSQPGEAPRRRSQQASQRVAQRYIMLVLAQPVALAQSTRLNRHPAHVLHHIREGLF